MDVFFKEWKTSDVYTLPSKLKNVSDDSIIHGWMMFDPMEGFIPEDFEETNMYKNIWDALIWFMNIAVMYHRAAKEGTLNKLDFRMHHHLRSSQKVKWEKRFVAKPEYWR